ncbi:protein ITPRID2-like [Vanacampus margaritifer]
MHPANKEIHNGLTSNVPEVLQWRSEDAEETLWQLGFGCDDPQITVRIPPRFLSFPSQARGIDLRLFLESQVRRIREEDHSLCMAGRFRQVQALTAMANTFCSLYSHVSRTPLRKLGAPQFTVSLPHTKSVKSNLRSSARSEPRSPAERLKDTVSKMCLYTSASRRSSLPDVAHLVPKQDKTETNKILEKEENGIGTQVMLETYTKQNDSIAIADQLKPVATVTYELISPKIVERVHQANVLHHVFSKMKGKDKSSHGVQNKSTVSESASRPLGVQTPAVSSDVCQHFISDILPAKPPRCINYVKNCDKEILHLEEVDSAEEEETATQKVRLARGGGTPSNSSGLAVKDTLAPLQMNTTDC